MVSLEQPSVADLFIIGGGNAIVPTIPAGGQAILMLGLSALATYFHINPSQPYNTSGVK